MNSNTKYKLRLSKKIRKELDNKISVIHKDKSYRGPVVNMLLKNKEILSNNVNKSNNSIS